MVFLHEKSDNKVTKTNLSQPLTFSTEVLKKRAKVLRFLALAVEIAATFILQRKVQKTINGAQIRCNRMPSLNHSKALTR